MDIGGLHLTNPIMNAAGTLQPEAFPSGIKDLYGALVTKTVTLEPREGNPPPRIAGAPCGMINSIGLQNVGIDKFLEEELDLWAATGRPVIVSIGGDTVEDYENLALRLREDSRVAAIELNASCPNTAKRVSHCADPKTLSSIVYGVRSATVEEIPLILKLGFDNYLFNSLDAALRGVDAITLMNTLPALAWPSRHNPEPFLGGLSGPAIKPIALRAVWEVSWAVDIPIIGCGGISSSWDIKEFFRVRASCVQVGSASFTRDPRGIVESMQEGQELPL